MVRLAVGFAALLGINKVNPQNDGWGGDENSNDVEDLDGYYKDGDYYIYKGDGYEYGGTTSSGNTGTESTGQQYEYYYEYENNGDINPFENNGAFGDATRAKKKGPKKGKKKVVKKKPSNNNKPKPKPKMTAYEKELAKLKELQTNHFSALNDMESGKSDYDDDYYVDMAEIYKNNQLSKPKSTPKEPPKPMKAPSKPKVAQQQSQTNSRTSSQSSQGPKKTQKTPNDYNYEMYRVTSGLNAIMQAVKKIVPDLKSHFEEDNSDHYATVSLLGADDPNETEEITVPVDRTTGSIVDPNNMSQANRNLFDYDTMTCEELGICTTTTQNKKTVKQQQAVAYTTYADEWNYTFQELEIINLQNYGCWCPKLLRERCDSALMGRPIDDLDRVCRDWFRCKRCASLAPYHCPIKKDYVYDVTHFNSAGAISCEAIKDDSCAYYNCLCDSDMVLDIISNIGMLNVTGIGVDVEECVRGDDWGGHVIDSCCGEFPNVTPYSSEKFICVDGKVHDLTYYLG